MQISEFQANAAVHAESLDPLGWRTTTLAHDKLRLLVEHSGQAVLTTSVWCLPG